MAQAIQIQINADLLDLTKAYKGKKGNYITISGIVKDEEDQYGNRGFVKQFVPENNDMPILGNIKIKELDSKPRYQSKYSNHTHDNTIGAENRKEVGNFEDDTLPF